MNGETKKATAGELVPAESAGGGSEGGAMLPAAVQPTGLAPGSTQGISELTLAAKEVEALTKSLDPEREVEIRADGVVYIPVGCIRQRLDEAFGPGQWGVRQEREPFYDRDTDECVYDGSLWVRGRFVARALGGCRWKPANKQMGKSDAIEGAKSDCLRRCCKDLGVARECWQPAWIREFLAEWGEPYQGVNWQGKPTVQWRKRGVSLGGEVLAKAGGIAGEFPLGFSENSPLPDGPMAGKRLCELPEEMLPEIAQKAKTVEWRLAAKAEQVRRIRAAAEAAESSETSVEDMLAGDNGEDGEEAPEKG